VSELKKRLLLNSRSSDKGPQKNDGRWVQYSVDPEERDYYYNLDFLCGTYHNPKNRGHRVDIEPWHGLGYGEEE
jgi:hypothetical protein